MRKQIFKSGFFLKCLMVLLAIGWSTNAVWADYYRLRVVAICDGLPAESWVSVGHSSAPTAESNEYTMAVSSTSSNPTVAFKSTAREGETIVGWFLDPCCTQLVKTGSNPSIYGAAPSVIPRYATVAEVQIQTIYAKFTKRDNVNWTTIGKSFLPDIPSEGNYYIRNNSSGNFLYYDSSDQKLKANAVDINDALLFTLSRGEGGAATISAVIGNETKYLNQDGTGLTASSVTHTIEYNSAKRKESYRVHLAKDDEGGPWYWFAPNESAANANITTYFVDATTNTGQCWFFIPEDTVLNYTRVYEKKSDGSVTISESPEASGTAYVSFSVSNTGNASQHFTYTLPNGSSIDGPWALGEPTRCGNIITVPVTYTAQNIHSGTETPASTTEVTITSTAETPTSAEAVATAYVDLQPTFEMAVSELDWSTKPEGEEIYNVGMEVAASDRERLQNKLVYSSANAFAQNATWKASIIGDDAEHFKFANGTQSVSGPYSAELLDVIYAPKAAGTHTATLQVEISHTDANSKTLKCVREVALSGKARLQPMITMTLNGDDISFTDSIHVLGDIIGTNSKYDTIDLFIRGVTDSTKSWTVNAAGAFEFNVDTLDLSKTNQRLIIRAHRSTPVTEATNYEATLTVSGKDGDDDISATLTLQYTAKPLIPTTVTWNWTLLNEDATYTNPITTNSDGEWTLVQRDGNGGMTYNAETKSITTEYMHHESGYVATFEFNIPQTDTYTARVEIDTFYARINAYVPPVIEIKNQANVDEYVVSPTYWDSYLTYDPTTNAIICSGSNNVYFQWSGQSTFAFDYEMSTQYSDHSSGKIYGIYEDDTQQEIFSGDFYNDSTHLISVPPTIKTLRLNGNNTYKNIRYFEYDTIDVNYHGVVFVDGGATTRDITATFANKRAVTVSLNAAAQPYFELRAEGKPTGSSLVYDNADGLAVHKFVKGKKFTVAIKDGVNYADAKAAAVNGFQVILQDNYTYNSEVVVLPIALEESYQVTYKHDANGSYKVTYHDDMEHPHTVSSADYVHTVSSIVETSCTATLSEPMPASGYMFRGWKLNGNLVSCNATCTLVPASGAIVEPVFVPAEEAVYGLDNTVFADLDDALSTAGSIADTKPVVVLLKDVTLEAATHTIPVDVTLLIPYKDDFNVLQTTPEITTTDEVLSAYRTLTLKEGANIVCNGTICVSGKIKATGGGFKSAYTTGECGVINMATGGHIELNEGANLYCWGYIKGQDMDQGNNTVGTGTITVNNGAIVHENFELGDWRGGTASSNIYYEKDTKHLFPFQSYALQNVEIPTTYTYGSKLETFMAVNTGFGSIPFAVSMIGSQNTLFLLQDEGSVIRKWYDPTTDLTCYELSGTAQLDELVMNLPFVGNFKSGDCNLPVSNSMHVILANCDMTLSKPLTVQAGAVLEIKNTATVDLTAKIHLFDVDEWGLYIHNYYFRSFNNLTSHKNRGAENEKTGLDDAKFIIDGVLNVKAGQGYIYSTAGGANLMGNGGGKIVFEGALPTADELWHVTVLGVKPYINWVPTPEAAANLCNEDGSYTKSTGFTSYYNIHGRWFYEDKKDEQPDHTYDFYYLDNGNTGEEEFASAVYSHDKTGLEARMKWFNVVRTADNCTDVEDDLDNPFTSNWWLDTIASPAVYYNYTMLGEWHQFIATETENVYSGSNNVLYRKADCDWAEEGYIDENCLYTIGGVKKALVDGHFIPLTPNGNDPAYHATANASQYYICFTGCNWHPATPYVGESKAYTIHPEDEDLHYIWFNNDWLNVLRDEPFFYTEDEVTNVRTYYEYVNGEWEIATPYVSVRDAAETRTFYMIKEAFNVASIKKNATITLLRDIPNVTEVLTYTTQNTNCTLDLNGHLLAGNIANLITVNAPGATFTITDNAALKSGKISNAASKAVYVQKGTLVVANGTIESTAAYAIDGAATTAITINGGYFAAGTQCVHTTGTGTCSISGGHFNKNAGLASYAAAHKYPFETTDPKYKWEVSDAWTIIFKNEETTLQTLHLKPGEMPVYTADQPTKDGYKFTGWNTPIVAATADATYTAQFAAIAEGSKCVTFNSNGGNEGLQYVYVASGAAVGTLPTATKDGYTFDGWFTEASAGTQINAETTISEDVTYYAHYTIASYTLTWDANGGNLSGSYTSGMVQYGAAITAPTATKEGHTFLRWNVTPAATMPAQDVTYTAQWSIAVKHYLQNIDGTYPETPEATENISGDANEYVTPAVKTYDGFISPATQTVQIGDVTDEVTYKYVRRTYTIILDANGGTCATTSLTVKHGATPTLPVATKNGTPCSGWFTKAIGGDQVTNETEILFNIGTLYAQYADLNVTAPLTVSDTREVSDLRITTTGSLTINGSVTTNNFILESNGATASGQFVAGYNKLTYEHAYFDLKLNAKNHQWYAVAVPWLVDATSGVSVNGKTLELGKDFDIIYYDGTRRATEGKQKCWKYVEDDGDKTLVPGRLYMIGLMSDAATVRFEKTTGALLTTTTSVAAHASTTGDETDKGWNGVANPALFHAFVNPGTGEHPVTEGQVYNPDTKSYSLITLNANKFVVGEGAFVQVSTGKAITVTKDGAFAAPRRTRAQANLIYDVRIAPANGAYTDRLFIKTTDSKENVYTVGQDLAKVGVSSIVPQMWINRYDAKLCVNTAELISETAEYPLGISVPANGEYTISNVQSPMSDEAYTLYLTLNGQVIWNLSNGAYTLTLSKGTSNEYGLRISAKSPAVATDIDEALVDAQGDTKKVLINDQVFIIRGENVYTIDGQLVK